MPIASMINSSLLSLEYTANKYGSYKKNRNGTREIANLKTKWS